SMRHRRASQTARHPAGLPLLPRCESSVQRNRGSPLNPSVLPLLPEAAIPRSTPSMRSNLVPTGAPGRRAPRRSLPTFGSTPTHLPGVARMSWFPGGTRAFPRQPRHCQRSQNFRIGQSDLLSAWSFLVDGTPNELRPRRVEVESHSALLFLCATGLPHRIPIANHGYCLAGRDGSSSMNHNRGYNSRYLSWEKTSATHSKDLPCHNAP